MNNSQIGRSMIEMLGVLAIIGVLSVGGLDMVSKARRNNQMNSLVKQLLVCAAIHQNGLCPKRPEKITFPKLQDANRSFFFPVIFLEIISIAYPFFSKIYRKM